MLARGSPAGLSGRARKRPGSPPTCPAAGTLAAEWGVQGGHYLGGFPVAEATGSPPSSAFY